MPKPDDYERGNRLRRAARELGLTGALFDLPAADAADVRRRVTAHFVYDPLDWWWQQLKSGRVYWNTSQGWDPLDEIAEMCVDEPVWLLPNDPFGEAFEARMPVFVELLKKSRIDEYALVSRDLAWLLIVNHHDVLYGSGERVTEHMLRIEQRPGSKGADCTTDPPEG